MQSITSKLRLKLTVLAAVMLFVTASAQVNTRVDNLIPPSPEAAALGKYVTIPVGLYTGTPQISIPLWEVKEGDISVPISFSYHASGHRVDEVAPRTGMGWTLNAGGVVTRTIVDAPDESAEGFLNFSQTTTPEGFNAGTEEERGNRYYAVAGCADAEPDQFSFNFGGYTGKFVFNWNREIVVSCDRKIKVEPGPISDGYFQSWKITTEEGVVYEFTMKETSETVSSDNINPCTYINPPVSSWHLSKITSPNGPSVYFYYQPYSLEYLIRSSEAINHKYGYLPASTNPSPLMLKIKGQYLKQISTSSGNTTVEFISDTTRRMDVPGGASNNLYPLDKVIVKNKEGQTIKHFEPEYDYSIGRLTLKKIHELPIDANTLSKPPYQFNYWGKLPSFPTDGVVTFYNQDHWGYSNDNGVNTLIPPYAVKDPNGAVVFYPGANRESSASGSKAGSLTQIVYPTGGSTTFEYEPHDYSFMHQTPVEDYDIIEKDQVTIQHDGSVASEYTTVPFTVGGDIVDERGIHISVDTRYCSTTGLGGGSLGPQLTLYDANGNLLRGWSHSTDQVTYHIDEYLNLTPGNYTLKAWTGKGECYETYSDGTMHNIGWDAVQAMLTWQEFGTIKKRRNKLAGGIRIKKITDSDGISAANAIVRTFDYTMPEGSVSVSSGVIFEEPVYNFNTIFYEVVGYSASGLPIEAPIPYVSRISNNVVMLGTTQGSHIGYRQVNILYGKDGKNGKSESFFSSIYDYNDGISHEQPFQMATSVDYRRGLLREQIDYKKEGESFIRVKKLVYDYDYTDTGGNLSMTYVPAFKVGRYYSGTPLIESLNPNTFAIGAYWINLSLAKVKNSTEIVYENDLTFKTEQTYSYDPTLQFLMKQTSKTSEGKELVTEYSYPFNYPSSASVIGSLNNRHIFPVIETVVKERSNGSEKVINASFTQFQEFDNKILMEKQLQLATQAPLADFQSSVTLGGNFDSRYREVSVINRYNTNGFPQQVTTPGNVVSSYIWDDNNLLQAYVTNAPFTRCAFLDFEKESGFGNWTFNPFQNYLAPNGKTGKYCYAAKGAITSQNLEAGKYIVSLWAKSQTGEGNITVNNVSKAVDGSWRHYQWILNNPAQVIVSSDNENRIYIDDLRLHPMEAQMKTFTHEPGVGVTSITDANNKTVYYEYDGLGRLKTIKDQEGNILKNYRYQYKNN